MEVLIKVGRQNLEGGANEAHDAVGVTAGAVPLNLPGSPLQASEVGGPSLQASRRGRERALIIAGFASSVVRQFEGRDR